LRGEAVVNLATSRHSVLGMSVLTALILETAVFPHLAVHGIRPDLVTVVVACWGLLYGPREGFLAGLGAGLVQDLLFTRYIGLFALAGALAGFLTGTVESKIFKESVWVSTAAVGVAVLGHEFVVWVLLRGLGVPAPALSLLTVALPGALYSTVFAPFVYRRLLLFRFREWAREREMTAGAGQVGQG